LGNTDKIAIRNCSCQQLTAKNKCVRIVELGHAEEGDKKMEKLWNQTAWKIRSLPKSDGRENALNNRQKAALRRTTSSEVEIEK
jgi:hypothetical protein